MHGFIKFSNSHFLQILTVFTKNLNFHDIKVPEVLISWQKETRDIIPNICKSVLSNFEVHITFLSENIKKFLDFLLFSKKRNFEKIMAFVKNLSPLKYGKEKYQVVGRYV